MTESVHDVPTIRSAFRMDTWHGRSAVLAGLLVLVAPSLAHFVSSWFLVLLGVAFVLSLLGISKLVGGRKERITRLATAGYALAFNGGLLIIALFVVGFLGDFAFQARRGLVADSVALGFTTVHVMLGIGLLFVDNYRHADPD